MTNKLTLDNLVQRMEYLERENCWLKTLSIAHLIVLSLIFLIGATHTEKEEVRDKFRARQFVVVDKKGKERAILGIDEQWSTVGLNLYTNDPAKDGMEPRPSLSLETWPEGNPRLSFLDKKRENRVWLHASEDGGSIFCLGTDCSSGSIKARATIYVKTNGSMLTLDGGGEKAQTMIHVNTDGSSFTLYDDNKTPRAVLGSTSLEVTSTGMAEKRPESSLVLFDKKGKVIWKAPQAYSFNCPSGKLCKTRGQTRMALPTVARAPGMNDLG